MISTQRVRRRKQSDTTEFAELLRDFTRPLEPADRSAIAAKLEALTHELAQLRPDPQSLAEEGANPCMEILLKKPQLCQAFDIDSPPEPA